MNSFIFTAFWILLSISPNDIVDQIIPNCQTGFLEIVGSWPFGSPYDVEVDSNRNLCFCSAGGGVFIFDVSDPSAIEICSDAIRTQGRVYQLSYDPSTQLLGIALGASGFEVWDTAEITAPEKVTYLYSDAVADCVLLCDTLFYLFDSVDEKVKIYDIGTQSVPELLGDCNSFGGINLSHMIRNDDYLFLSKYGGLYSIDVSDPSNPFTLDHLELPSYHSELVFADGYIFLASLFEGFRVVDASDPLNLVDVALLQFPYVSHGLTVTGNVAVLSVTGYGLYTIDVSSPQLPVLIGECLLDSSCVYNHEVVNGIAVLPSWDNGIYTIDISTPSSPSEVQHIPLPNALEEVRVSDGIAYFTDRQSGIHVLDVTSPDNPIRLCSFETPDEPRDISLGEDLLLIADRFGGMRIVDVSNPSFPEEVGSYEGMDEVYSVHKHGSYALISGYPDGYLDVIDISDPTNPLLAASYVNGIPSEIVVSNGILYITTWRGLEIFDFTDPLNMVELGVCSSPKYARDFALHNDYAFIADAHYGLHIVNVSNPTAPYVEYVMDSMCDIHGIEVFGNYAYLADWENGVVLLDISNPVQPTVVDSICFASPTVDVAINEQYIYASSRRCGSHILLNGLTGVTEGGINSSTSFSVCANPSQSAVLLADIDEPGVVRVNIHDCTGRVVNELVNGYFFPGQYSFNVSSLPTGVYHASVEVNGVRNSISFVVLGSK